MPSWASMLSSTRKAFRTGRDAERHPNDRLTDSKQRPPRASGRFGPRGPSPYSVTTHAMRTHSERSAFAMLFRVRVRAITIYNILRASPAKARGVPAPSLARLGLEDQARRRAVRQQLALRIGEAPLGGADAAAAV